MSLLALAPMWRPRPNPSRLGAFSFSPQGNPMNGGDWALVALAVGELVIAYLALEDRLRRRRRR